jgi:hypothetical protein
MKPYRRLEATHSSLCFQVTLVALRLFRRGLGLSAGGAGFLTSFEMISQ